MTVKFTSSMMIAIAMGCAEGAPLEGDDKGLDAGLREVDASDRADAAAAPDAAAPADAALADAALADAAEAADAAPPVCQTTQLLLNPAFDDTPSGSGWTQSPVAITSNAPVAPHTAPSSLWLGGYNNRSENVFQAVAVPAATTALELVTRYRVVDPENNTVAYDTATLTVRDEGDVVLHTVRAWNNTDPESTGWEVATFPIPTSVAGQTVRIHFAGRTDNSAPSSFQFDSLALNATVCP